MNLAVITARGGSKRIPRKNIRDFCGKPIIAYSIQAARDSGLFDEVIVSTDDLEIKKVAQKFGAAAPFLRSKKTSTDHATTAEVIAEVLEKYGKISATPDNVCCLYPTAPFVTAKILNDAYTLLMSRDEIDSVFPIVRFSFPIQRALKLQSDFVSMFNPENALVRSQDLEPAYHDAGQFYWVKTDRFLKSGTIIMEKSAGIPLLERFVQDIDNEEDWVVAEVKYRCLEGLK